MCNKKDMDDWRVRRSSSLQGNKLFASFHRQRYYPFRTQEPQIIEGTVVHINKSHKHVANFLKGSVDWITDLTIDFLDYQPNFKDLIHCLSDLKEARRIRLWNLQLTLTSDSINSLSRLVTEMIKNKKNTPLEYFQLSCIPTSIDGSVHLDNPTSYDMMEVRDKLPSWFVLSGMQYYATDIYQATVKRLEKETHGVFQLNKYDSLTININCLVEDSEELTRTEISLSKSLNCLIPNVKNICVKYSNRYPVFPINRYVTSLLASILLYCKNAPGLCRVSTFVLPFHCEECHCCKDIVEIDNFVRSLKNNAHVRSKYGI